MHTQKNQDLICNSIKNRLVTKITYKGDRYDVEPYFYNVSDNGVYYLTVFTITKYSNGTIEMVGRRQELNMIDVSDITVETVDGVSEKFQPREGIKSFVVGIQICPKS